MKGKLHKTSHYVIFSILLICPSWVETFPSIFYFQMFELCYIFKGFISYLNNFIICPPFPWRDTIMYVFLSAFASQTTPLNRILYSFFVFYCFYFFSNYMNSINIDRTLMSPINISPSRFS